MENLYYIHDPMCSWCYAFDTVLMQLECDLPKSIELMKIVGGLADDSIEPMSQPMAESIQANWRKIEQTVSHIQFNFNFWTNNQPVRSTYPACRAVLAAKNQSMSFENKMIAQIQWAYYKNAENPSIDKTLINCAKHIGLDCNKFVSDYNSQFIDDQLKQQILFARGLDVSSYPSLCLQLNKRVFMIKIDYNDAAYISKQIQNILNGD